MGQWIEGQYIRDPEEQEYFEKAKADLDFRIKNAVFVVHLCKSADVKPVCIGCKRDTSNHWESDLIFHEAMTPEYFHRELTTPWTRNGTRQVCQAALVASVMQS